MTMLTKSPEVWRYFSFRVFCATDPKERGIVKCYVANDNPEQKPLWVSNYHFDVPSTRERALDDINAFMYRIADGTVKVEP